MPVSTLKLFLIFLKVGAFTFGGGYAMIPVLERELVHRFKLMDTEEFYDTFVVCQSLPGAIAINFSVFTGLKLRGIKGAVAGLMGMIIPSFIVILTIAILLFQYIDNPVVSAFFQGVRLCVVALMLVAAFRMLLKHQNGFAFFMVILTFALIVSFTVHPFLVILLTGCLGYFTSLLKERVTDDAL